MDTVLRHELLIKLTMVGDNWECTCSQNMFHHSCNSGCKCADPGGGWTVPVRVSKYCNHGFVMPIKCIILTSSPNLGCWTRIRKRRRI